MDHQLVAAIQQAALQQQICNAMGMQLPFPQGVPMNFVGGGYGYGCPEGMPSYPLFDTEEVDEEDEDDEEQVRTLFCSNLDERVTEEILYEVFLQAGPIESARIPLDNTGRQRNFGFVTYQHKIAVPYAVELYQGLELFQKKLIIRQQCPEKPKLSAMGQGRTRNPFSQDFSSPAPPVNEQSGGQRHVRHSIQDGMQYAGPQKKYNSDARRRSDSAVIDRNRPRHQHQQHQQHNNSGGNRRSDQRYNHGRRLL
ncbi:RNA-binding protein 7 [Drosophila mojavensis]|uniref:RRM domain-containing protein n=1 Tax=Drosophila mojavensis TaxID=7230 RepID=B4KFP3_DROMO|nr:RNA-binding protein 7 [Drosophila mojavensis]EDW11008.1 uncharacterized protein Dmoj_GI16471 [Drosophila mojavensis]